MQIKLILCSFNKVCFKEIKRKIEFLVFVATIYYE